MKNPSLAEKAYIAIKKDILTCQLFPGSQVAQSQLVEHYEFGVTPIREALKRLENENFVRSIPRYGYIINPVTIKDIEDIYGLRLILETSAVRLAIQCASDEELMHLQDGVDFTYTFKDRETYLEFLQHNIDFHVAIAMASGNRKLAEMLRGVLNDMTQIFNLGLDLRDSALEMRHEHVALAKALAARDLENAVEIITDQIHLSRQRVMEEISDSVDQRVVSRSTL